MGSEKKRAKLKDWVGEDKTTDNIKKQIKDKSEVVQANEPAWSHVTRKPGLIIWRVNQLQLELVPKDDIGTFYDGDSYLILSTYLGPEPDKILCYNIFMWIGSQSTPDEYGVAAYKMAELDRLVLGGSAVQHRETQGNETEKFQSLFKSIKIKKGGYDKYSRNREKKAEVTPKLFHISGIRKNVKCVEVSYRFENLNSGDVFLIDDGETIYQINGKTSSKQEREKAAQVIMEFKSEKEVKKVEIIEESKSGLNHPVIKSMPRKNVATIKKKKADTTFKFVLLRISDSTGALKVDKVKDKKASLKDFDPNDVFIYDTNDVCFIWSGSKISYVEGMIALPSAEVYLHKTGQMGKNLQIIKEGKETIEFYASLIDGNSTTTS